MNVTVVGTGYVGLVTGSCLAEAGHQVICVDNNAEKVAEMKEGVSPIFEPGLEDILRRNLDLGRISFTTSLSEGVADAQAVFLALPTPPQDDGSADLSAVLAVAKELGQALPENYCVVINKSTAPVGTAEDVKKAISESGKTSFDVVSNPEFLREGHAVVDFMEPERVVVGVNSTEAEAVMRELYAGFVSDERPLYVTDPQTAELTKYAANTFLVTKISFMNEIAQLCELMDADVDMVRKAIGADSRIGPKFLYPGIGCGGSCFPKDVRALKHMSEQHGYDFKLLSAAMEINDQQKHVLFHKVLDHFGGNVRGKVFALWGLAFKPNTDDIREAPALVIIDALASEGAKIVAFDPEAGDQVSQKYAGNPNVQIVSDKYDALEGASALLIATEWPEFAASDPEQIKKSLQLPLIFDGRNVFSPKEMKATGFTYYSIGHRPVLQETAKPAPDSLKVLH
jgi:UDPglucose 6-dehydrogenase